jgi:hypothetical protein
MSEYRSSEGMFKEFLKSSIWKDMVYELEQWMKDIHEMLEDADGDLDFGKIKKLQGNIETLRNVKDMPQNILDNIRDDVERTNRKETKENA